MKKQAHSHQADHTQQVRKALRWVSEFTGVAYQTLFHQFVAGDPEAGLLFWGMFWGRSKTSRQYNDVYYCPGCRHFDPEFNPDAPGFTEMEEMVCLLMDNVRAHEAEVG